MAKHSEKVQSIQPTTPHDYLAQEEAAQPMTSAGSNLDAPEPKAVGNVTLETTIDPNAIVISDDEIEAVEIALAIAIAQAAIGGKAVGPLITKAVALLPTDRDAATKYCQTLQRMQMMAESVVRETRVALYQKFGT